VSLDSPITTLALMMACSEWAMNMVGVAGVLQALAWRCASECLHAMCVRANMYVWRCVHAIVRVCVAVPRQQRAAR
jgi:hypothetical protein